MGEEKRGYKDERKRWEQREGKRENSGFLREGRASAGAWEPEGKVREL